MLTFTPPKGFRDISEYSFAANGRQVVVRSTHELGSAADLLTVAKDYAGKLQEYLHAENVQVSLVNQRADGSSYVTVEAAFSGQKEIERSAFVLLGNGTSLQLSLRAGAMDLSSESEFQRLVRTVHAAPPDVEGQAISVATPGEDVTVRHAGPALLTLPSEYENHTLLKFRNPAGTLVTLKYEQHEEAGTTPMEAKGVLGKRVNTVDDRGQSFGYETGEDPWKARLSMRTAKARIAADVKPEATRVRDLGPRQRVTIRVHGPVADVTAADLAEQVMSSVKLDEQNLAPAIPQH
jgi:hypothetical protein